MLYSLAPSRSRLRAGLLVAMIFAALTLLNAGSALATGGTAKVTGQVTAPSAGAAADITAELLDASGDEVDSSPTLSHTGTTVTYTFNNEPAGTYLVSFADSTPADNVPDVLYSSNGATQQLSAATQIQVAAGASVGLNTIALPSGGSITGQITDPNAQTVLTDSEIEACPYPETLQIDCTVAKVGATGAYTLPDLASGNYRVAYTPENSSNDPIFSDADLVVGDSGALFVAGSGVSYNIAQATIVSVGAGSVANVSFTVPKAAVISGTATVLGTAASADLLVAIYNTSGVGIGGATTSAAGAYTELVLPGSYKVEASSEYEGFGLSSIAPAYFGGATFAAATTENVTAGETVPNVNIDLGEGATITGKITAAQGGGPLGGLRFALVDASGNSALGPLQQFYSDYLSLLGAGIGIELSNYETGADGSYTILGVPAGTWYLEIDGGLAWNGSDYLPIFYGGTPTIAGAKPITVTAGQTATVNQALLQQSATAPGLPTESGGGLSGLAKGKVALKFTLTAGSGVAADLQSFTVKLPKGFSWDAKTLKQDLSLGAVPFTYATSGGELVVTFTAGERSAALSIKAGGITVTKAIQEAAGGGPKPKAKLGKNGRRVKPKPRKDTIKTETVSLTATDTTGTVTPLSLIISKPH